VEYVKIRVVNKKEERMMNNSLYTLTKDFVLAMEDLNDMIEEGLEISDHAYADTLEVLQMPLEEKCENIVKYIKSLEAIAEARKTEAKRLNELADKDLKKAESLKNYMADNLKKANIDKLQAGVFSLGWRKGSEVVEIDETKLPETINVDGKEEYSVRLYDYTRTKKIIPKPELKKLIKAGAEIPGVSIVRNPDSLVVK
jgi:Siphovirus Gp157